MNSWLHLGQGLLLGCGLGLYYGFLRPLQPRWLGDLFFLIALFGTWIYLGFGLCGGDLRMAYTLTLPIGSLLWEFTFGAALRPVFSSFWKGFFHLFSYFLHPFKIILKKSGNFLIFLFARSRKWVTIKCNQHPSIKTKNRRNPHGKAKSLPSDPPGLPP